MTEIAPFSEEKSCPRLCQVHLYREKLTIEVKVLILPFGIFLFSKNVGKATDSKPAADPDLLIQGGHPGP